MDIVSNKLLAQLKLMSEDQQYAVLGKIVPLTLNIPALQSPLEGYTAARE